LALDDHLFDMVEQHWALYPTMPFFLGAQANFKVLHLFKQFYLISDPSQATTRALCLFAARVFLAELAENHARNCVATMTRHLQAD
jgi:hypothetical protein